MRFPLSVLSKRIAAGTAATTLLFLLAACGGGGVAETPAAPTAQNPTPAPTPAPVPTAFTVSGIAATGAPFAGATVSIIGSDGTVYGGAGNTTGADGKYTITLPPEAKPPFVIVAARDDQSLTSVLVDTTDSTVNITPLTSLIASRLSTSGDPAKLAEEIKANPALISASRLSTVVTEVIALIKPLLDAVGDTTSNPITANLVANGTGHDRVLDSLSILIAPTSANSVNIAVSVKQQLADTANPQVLTFTNSAPLTGSVSVPSATALVPTGTAAQIADLLARLNTCYGLPIASRVASGGTTAAQIIAPECKDVFFGNDPAQFRSNGSVVSSTGSFTGIFTSGGTGLLFDRGVYEFTRQNGDIVVSYRTTNTSGSVNPDNTVAVRLSTDGKLRAIGNQFQFSGGIGPFAQFRRFLSQTGADYHATGYNASINNTTSGGVPIFDRVVVTAPTGETFTLKPNPGSSFLGVVRSNNTVSNSNVFRMRGEFTDAASAANDPALADTGLLWAPTRYTNAQIEALPAQAVWKYEYYLASNPTVIAATQTYRTRSRALTLPEFRAKPLATFTDTMIANLRAATQNVNNARFVPTPVSGPVAFAWVVPTGAQPITSTTIFGNINGGATFNDSTNVATTARSSAVTCSTQSTADLHCSGANFATNGRITNYQMIADAPGGLDLSSNFLISTITIP